MKKAKRMKAVTAWGGFIDGRLDWGVNGKGYGFVRSPAIFRNRTTAKKQYRDVRRVRISEVRRKP